MHPSSVEGSTPARGTSAPSGVPAGHIDRRSIAASQQSGRNAANAVGSARLLFQSVGRKGEARRTSATAANSAT